jgi:hypothetical protein
VTFKAYPPNGDRRVLLTDKVFIGKDDNFGGGSEAGLDASETYTLDFDGIEPHPEAGLSRETNRQRRRFSGSRQEAQGVLGSGLRPDDDANANTHQGAEAHADNDDDADKQAVL